MSVSKVAKLISIHPAIHPIQRSGTIPRARCITEECDCIYNSRAECRSKSYVDELLSFRAALCRTITTLRSGTPDETSWLIWETQSQKTDQGAIRYLFEGYQMDLDR